MRFLTTGALVAALVLPLVATGCPSKGPAQKAGEKVDKGLEKAEDAVNPKGPAEKAGRKIDRAVDDVKH